LFSRLELVAGIGNSDKSKLQLVFTCSLSQTEASPPLCDIAEFEFMTDKMRSDRHKEITRKLEPLRNRVENHHSELMLYKEKQDDLLAELKDEMQSFKQKNVRNSLLKTVFETPQKLKYDRLQGAKKSILPEIVRLEKPSRPSKKEGKGIPIEAAYSGENILGLAVDLGYVNDIEEARILSDAAGRYLSAVVCQNDAVARKLYDKKVKAWSLTRMRKYKKDDGSFRTAAEKLKQSLPLPHLNDPGNPRYLVNMIQLDRDHESLRDTLFFAMFDRTLLFDDKDSALSYQKKKIDMGVRPPAVLTMQGDRFLGDGVFDPTLRVRKEPQLMFGEQPFVKREDYMNFKLEVETADKLILLVRKRDEISDRIEELKSEQSDIDCDVSIIEGLEDELVRLRSE
jgi:chromosome segregation ATPase